VDGGLGAGSLSVPVPAAAQRTLGMQTSMGLLLFALMTVLSLALVAIIGAGVREAPLPPGAVPDADRRRRARMAMGGAAAVVLAVLYLGNQWWTAEAAGYSRYVYKPLQVNATVQPPGQLRLELSDPGWIRSRSLDDFVPDHQHLMHLFVVSLPGLERIWHLHPEREGPGVFTQPLPAMPAGRYQLYADVVHRSGFPETLAAEIAIPETAGTPLTGDDSEGGGSPAASAGPGRSVSALPSGARLVWERPPGPLKTRRLTLFSFRLETPDGRPAPGLQLYMGMPGHAAFLKKDRTVFAHVHPSGTAPMAALSLAAGEANLHAGHAAGALPPAVTFPYGLPQPGEYRVFVQVKHAGRVETGMFDFTAVE
jgi:hypothetical protein